MDPATTPRVRAAEPEDAPAVAALAAEALAAKYRPAFGAHAARGIEALVRAGIEGSEASRHWVATIDDRVAGAVHLVLDDEPGLGFARVLAGELGWGAALRATAVLSLLGPGRMGADEAYIDELAVAAWARRRGVARALLARCEHEARTLGRERLTLWVTEDNTGARSLYDGYGFRTTHRRRWILGRLLFGSPGALFMARELPPA